MSEGGATGEGRVRVESKLYDITISSIRRVVAGTTVV
jgi:hypothetical protein